MTTADQNQRTIRNTAQYIANSVHYSRRKFDNQYEIVAQATDSFLNDKELNIGGEIVLDVKKNRQEAVAAVRFYRKHENT